MHPQIEAMFDEAENRYLKPEELGIINQYVDSLPERLETYRLLRDKELDMMQTVADQLVAEMPQEKIETLERCIKNALLTLRYCAMGLLLNDEQFVKERLGSWLTQTTKVFNTKAIDAVLYRLLNQTLAQTLSPQQMNYLRPMLTLAENELLQNEPESTAIGW